MYSCAKKRCERCRMHEELCLCAELPSLDLRTNVTLLMHAQERHKPSNTGRLANLCLKNSEIRYRGLKDGTPLDLTNLEGPDFETWMLYLSDRSEAITAGLVASAPKPVKLLVLDGNWSQASRLGAMLARKMPGARHVKLAGGKPSEYQLRSEHHPDGLATFEAIARALGFLEGAEVQAELEHAFRKMRDRVLFTRGKISAEMITGGLPEK